MNKKVFVGVDGCSAGWFAVFLPEPDGGDCYENSCNLGKCSWELGVFPGFSALWDFLETNYGAYEPLVLIDIPIGLIAGGSGERLSDLGGRKVLKARKSSIFPVPCREAVYAKTYEEACEINERLTGKRISKQAWNILPKIRDVDRFLIRNKAARARVWEVGPEICFQAFAGRPMEYSKKKEEGFQERMGVLRRFAPFADEIVEAALLRYRRKDVARDDIPDALAAAFTAKLGSRCGFEYVPAEAEKDCEGLRMQLVYCGCCR